MARFLYFCLCASVCAVALVSKINLQISLFRTPLFEESSENENSGGYYYQPLNQDPDGGNATEEVEPGAETSHAEQVQQVQQRIEVMGLHLPEAPPLDSDDEDDPEGAAALRSHASIPMDADHVELVKRTMAAVALPVVGVPAWAQEISDDQWKDMVQHTLQGRQSAGALRLSGP